MPDFQRFAQKIAHHGAFNSLSQLLVKIASPGVADFYQGTELWDLRLVDPDNRRWVDFAGRSELLETSREDRLSLPELREHWQDGRIKMYLTQRGLTFRRNHSALVLRGDYLPLTILGAKQECVIAFARRYRGEWSTVIVPRYTTMLVNETNSPIGSSVWGNTRVVLPQGAPKTWVNVLDDENVNARSDGDRDCLSVGDVLRTLPVGLLVRVRE